MIPEDSKRQRSVPAQFSARALVFPDIISNIPDLEVEARVLAVGQEQNPKLAIDGLRLILTRMVEERVRLSRCSAIELFQAGVRYREDKIEGWEACCSVIALILDNDSSPQTLPDFSREQRAAADILFQRQAALASSRPLAEAPPRLNSAFESKCCEVLERLDRYSRLFSGLTDETELSICRQYTVRLLGLTGSYLFGESWIRLWSEGRRLLQTRSNLSSELLSPEEHLFHDAVINLRAQSLICRDDAERQAVQRFLRENLPR